MKGYLRFPLLLLIAMAPLAFADLSVRSLEAERSKWMTYRFPVFQGDSPALERINIYLHAFELEALPGRFQHSPFERVWPKKDEIWGVSSLDYEIHAQTSGFLSLDIIGEYTGPYLSLGRDSYAFDLSDGQPIYLTQLLSEAGQTRLGERLGQARVKRIEKFLAAIPAAAPGSEEAEIAETQRQMYAHCLPRHRESNLENDRLVLEENQLTLVAGRCSAHVSRALDDLGPFIDSYTYQDLAADLSPYGSCLLLERRLDCRRGPDQQAGGVYHGRIDSRHAITLAMRPPYRDGSFRAIYFYDKYARSIELSGDALENGHFELREHGDVPARFELRRDADGHLVGTWQQEGQPALPVELR